MDTPETLRQTAERCRRLASMCTDQEFSDRLEEVALECEVELDLTAPRGSPADQE